MSGLVRLTEVRGTGVNTEDCDVWVNPWGVNLVRPSSTDTVTFLSMDGGVEVQVRHPIDVVVKAIGEGIT